MPLILVCVKIENFVPATKASCQCTYHLRWMDGFGGLVLLTLIVSLHSGMFLKLDLLNGILEFSNMVKHLQKLELTQFWMFIFLLNAYICL